METEIAQETRAALLRLWVAREQSRALIREAKRIMEEAREAIRRAGRLATLPEGHKGGPITTIEALPRV